MATKNKTRETGIPAIDGRNGDASQPLVRVPLGDAVLEQAELIPPTFTAQCFDVNNRPYSVTVTGTDGDGSGQAYSDKCAASAIVPVNAKSTAVYVDPATGKTKPVGKLKGAISGMRAAADLAHHVYPVA